MAGPSRDPQMNHLHTEFCARFMQVILESRIPTFMPASSHSGHGSASTSSGNVRVPAFNLVLGKFGAIMDNIEPWCKGIHDPMVLDILCSRRGNDRVEEGLVQKVSAGAGNWFETAPPGLAFAKTGLEQPILLERWTLEYRPYRSQSSGKVERAQKEMFGTQKYTFGVDPSEYFRRGGRSGNYEHMAAYNVVEKEMTILLRSIYSTARLLPAQNLSRLLSTSGNSKFKMLHKVTTSPLDSNSKDMTPLHFTSIKTHCGLLQVSVAYRQKIPSMVCETYTFSPQIIPDYVGRAASLQSKKLLADKAGQAHSLPISAQRLASFKFDNLQQHRVPNKEAGARNLDHAHTVTLGDIDFPFVQDEGFECPFAIYEPPPDNRMDEGKQRAAKLDVGESKKPVTHVRREPLEVFQFFQRPAAVLSGAHHPKKDAANALKELKMYIDLRDCLLK